ncbi:MAG: DUF1980 domain-containing protein [Solidesulfovibrio sp.]
MSVFPARPLKVLAARLDGLAMLALACFMGWLVAYGNYWMFLNPKFKPVTLAAAGTLAVLGAYAAIRPVSRPSLGRNLCYAALLVMIVLTQGGVQIISQNVDSDPFLVPPTLPAPDAPSPIPSRMIARGKEYIPINTGELYDIAAKEHGAPFDRPYVIRGFVLRDPALDPKGEFVLFRLAIWCCFADSTAVGFKIKLPPGSLPPADKSWLVVYGHLADTPANQRQEYVMPGMSFSSVAPTALFVADHTEAATPAPEETYMYQWRQEEPYAY